MGNIIKELDCKSILLICKSSKKFDKFCELKLDTLLKQKLYKETGFITDAYNIEELIGLCRLYGTKHISTGDNHSLVLNDNGQVYSFGTDDFGQLGLHIRHMNEPRLIKELHNIKYISTGLQNSWAMNENGQLYSWGINEDRQLGSGNDIATYSPTLTLKILNNITQISAGFDRSFALNKNGQVYSWGSNTEGRLGLKDTKNRNTPTLVPEIPDNIVQLSTGKYHTLALTNTGEVYSWGSNTFGQLGLGDIKNINTPTLIPNLPNDIIQISTRSSHSLCLTGGGHMYSFGGNFQGELGLGDYDRRNIPTLIPNLNNIIQISAGYGHSLALSNTSKIYAFGSNLSGQLGLEYYNETNIPTLVPEAPKNIIQISAGNYHSLCLINNGRIYAFGDNKSGQLGLGDNDNRNLPKLIPNLNVLS